MNYAEFFRLATKCKPFPYQETFAVGTELPHVVRVPTGAGKTATAVVGWLWRRLFAHVTISSSTPTRLVYCLPMRVLVEQTCQNARIWLERLSLQDRIGLHILMGGEDVEDWHLHPEKEAILIGTQDMLLSRALNRGYGSSRYRWPIDFGLLSNDCLWIFDEVQLMGNGLATSTQLHAFRQIIGTCGISRSVWMSATFKEDWLYTVDFAGLGKILVKAEVSEADKGHGDLGKRIEALKQLHACPIPISRPDNIADAVLSAHRPESRTLVVVNTVKRAVDLYRALDQLLVAKEKSPIPELLLIHSRFRPPERRRQIELLLAAPPAAGLIAVTTQVVEAGVDVDARTLFTELAPWSSLVQRFGRCNRRGEFVDAAVYWIDLFNAEKEHAKGKKRSKKEMEAEIAVNVLPYTQVELAAAASQLREMDDVSIAHLEARIARLDQETHSTLFPYDPQHVIRRKDMIELFDTTPDLAGNDIDVSRFIREGEDLDAHVFWRKTAEEGPTTDEQRPTRDELCTVRTNQLREFVGRRKSVYQWDFLDERWRVVTPREVFPGHTYLIPDTQGGYSPMHGWDAKSDAEVTVIETSGLSTVPDADGMDSLSGSSAYERMDEHTEKVVAILSDVLGRLDALLNTEMVEAIRIAGRWHDRGKAHEVFQHAIEPDEKHHNGCWAKAPKMFRYERKGFRHELASALAMIHEKLPDLACYLVGAHHGKVRLSIRSLPHEKPPLKTGVRFARGIWDGDTLPAVDLGGEVIAPAIVLSLEPMELGLSPSGEPSWVERVLVLRDDLGPFRLAFLEAILRAADMRASSSSVLAVKGDHDA